MVIQGVVLTCETVRLWCRKFGQASVYPLRGMVDLTLPISPCSLACFKHPMAIGSTLLHPEYACLWKKDEVNANTA